MQQQYLIAAGKAPTDQTRWQEPERPARPALPDPAVVRDIRRVIERAGGPSFEALASLKKVTGWVPRDALGTAAFGASVCHRQGARALNGSRRN